MPFLFKNVANFKGNTDFSFPQCSNAFQATLTRQTVHVVLSLEEELCSSLYMQLQKAWVLLQQGLPYFQWSGRHKRSGIHGGHRLLFITWQFSPVEYYGRQNACSVWLKKSLKAFCKLALSYIMLLMFAIILFPTLVAGVSLQVTCFTSIKISWSVAYASMVSPVPFRTSLNPMVKESWFVET